MATQRKTAMLGVFALMLALMGIFGVRQATATPGTPATQPGAIASFDDDDDDDGDDGAHGNEGQNGDDAGDDGGDEDRSGPNPGQEDDNDDRAESIEAVEPYAIEVSCQADAGDIQTHCMLDPVYEGDDDDNVLSIEIPASPSCTAPVLTGGAVVERYSHMADDDDDSTNGRTAFSVTLKGLVTTHGTGTYWLSTEDSRYPAKGPALVCAAEPQSLAIQAPEPTPAPTPTEPATPEPTTGSVRIEAFSCPVATPVANVDWFSVCQSSGSELQFRLGLPDEEPAGHLTETTNAAGQVTFEDVDEGAYELTEVDRSWCHAESDSVDASGHVVVDAGELATVWIFNCDGTAGS